MGFGLQGLGFRVQGFQEVGSGWAYIGIHRGYVGVAKGLRRVGGYTTCNHGESNGKGKGKYSCN